MTALSEKVKCPMVGGAAAINSNPERLRRVKAITGKPVELIEGDVWDKALLNRVFSGHRIDCVFHFAGLKAVGESVAKPLEYYQSNLCSTMNLCEIMAKHDVKKIIYLYIHLLQQCIPLITR